MIQRVLLILIGLAIAIGGGAASVAWMLDRPNGLGALSVGGWTAYPDLGTPDADPYSKARVARDGVLTLGRAEGIVFVAETDSGGAPLRRGCDYRIEGTMPTARFWTLFAADRARVAIPDGAGEPPAVHSQQILRRPDNSFAVAFGPHPAPGNWVAVGGAGPLAFLLTLYDTPLALGAGADDVPLPQVLRIGCDG